MRGSGRGIFNMAEQRTEMWRKELLQREIQELTVLQNELSNLKANRSVYTQQGNSDVYFKTDHVHTLSHINHLLDERTQEWNKLTKQNFAEQTDK
ncbi:ASNSD1 upstream open reading frame protein-like [Corticium candelabrum]|uniref:ASNSD1 upstream open reading frame protein-like n=1 Tax=Corticium candelabrum TaxID=121492 RepID=UPI002E26E7B3|nr:ASNSD1 upstream open reading frame protein-like [Corticium candelabrum]